MSAGDRLAVRRAALSRLAEALDGLGVASWPAPGAAPVLSLWPGLHAGVSLDATRYGWTAGDLVVTHPADDVALAAYLIAQQLDLLLGGARGWLA